MPALTLVTVRPLYHRSDLDDASHFITRGRHYRFTADKTGERYYYCYFFLKKKKKNVRSNLSELRTTLNEDPSNSNQIKLLRDPATENKTKKERK